MMLEQPQLTRLQWEEIGHGLREPFDPKDVDFRVQSKANTETGKAQVVAYIDARAVQERLDAVVGPGNWSFDWDALTFDGGEVKIAKGVLTIYGISKADAGSASNFEQTLGAVSHCFKRAAVHWGIGRYLYHLPMAWVPVERGGRISETVLNQLRAKLPRPGGDQPAQDMQTARQQEQEPAAEDRATDQQMQAIRKLCLALGHPAPGDDLTFLGAKERIAELGKEYERARREEPQEEPGAAETAPAQATMRQRTHPGTRPTRPAQPTTVREAVQALPGTPAGPKTQSNLVVEARKHFGDEPSANDWFYDKLQREGVTIARLKAGSASLSMEEAQALLKQLIQEPLLITPSPAGTNDRGGAA